MSFMGLDLTGSGVQAAAFAGDIPLLAGVKVGPASLAALSVGATLSLNHPPVSWGGAKESGSRKRTDACRSSASVSVVALRLATTGSPSLSREEISQCMIPIAP
jgi:hypothetical protein